MPGQYIVVARAAGTLITDLIYIFDHQNHVDGRSALEMGAYGVSTAQFQLTEDPLNGVGDPVLAPSLAGELTRLRFVLAQIITEFSGGTLANWYDPMTAAALPAVGARIHRQAALTVPNAFPTVISFSGAAANFNTGVWDNMTNPTRFTAPSPGKYLASCNVTWAALGGNRILELGVNSVFAGQAITSSLAPNAATHQQSVDGLLELNANDYVEFRVSQSTGTGTTLIADGSFSIVGSLVFLGTNP